MSHRVLPRVDSSTAYHSELAHFIGLQEIKKNFDGDEWIDPNKEDAFGGTRDMIDAEQDFAQAMMGGQVGSSVTLGAGDVAIKAGTAANASGFTNLDKLPTRPAGYTEAQGHWLRALNKGGVYMYVHTYTRQLSAARPQGAGPYKEDAPADPEKAARDKRRKEVEEMRKSFPTFELQDVHAAARDVIAGKKTPLVLYDLKDREAVLAQIQTWGVAKGAKPKLIPDPTDTPPAKEIPDPDEAEPSDWEEDDDGPWEAPMVENPAFADWKPRTVPESYVIDCRPFVLPIRRTKIKFADHLETSRCQIRDCMLAGKLLVIDVLEHCPDFVDKICHAKNKGVFPIELFQPERCTTLGCSKGVFVRAKGDKSPKVAPGFGVVVMAAKTPESYSKELKSTLTTRIFNHLQAIRVVT